MLGIRHPWVMLGIRHPVYMPVYTTRVYAPLYYPGYTSHIPPSSFRLPVLRVLHGGVWEEALGSKKGITMEESLSSPRYSQ